MKRVNKFRVFILLSLIFLCFCTFHSCTKEKRVTLEKQNQKEYHIAVVLPFSKGMESKWRKSVDWALENLNAALIDQRHIRVSAEWYDSDIYDLKRLFSELAARKDISAIIGPLYAEDAMIAAEECARTNMPLFPATVSSEMLMRTFAGKGFLWCLTENDISQCEMLLTKAKLKDAETISLLTCDNNYGNTFLDWFAFQAQELGLKVKGIEVYSDEDVEKKMKLLVEENVDCIICVPSNNLVTQKMNEVRKSSAPTSTFFLFSDVAFMEKPDMSFEGLEGFTQTYDPESGFHVSYQVRFGEPPEYGSAHFYDAVLLAGLGILEADLAKELQINTALERVVSGEGDVINGCSNENVALVVTSLINRKYPKLTGASGKLLFDNTVYTSVLHSVYSYCIVYNGKYLILEYNTSDASKRTSSSVANWNWETTEEQKFSETLLLDYPKKQELYALIVASSSGWENYRHQANAFAFYKLLKRNGLSDDNIIMIAEDDIAYNSKNINLGELRIRPDGKEVYKGVPIDYHPSNLKFEDILTVLSGTDTGPSIKPDEADNLLVYWVGHGVMNGLEWFDKIIPVEDVGNLFQKMADEKRFRKLLFVTETCYSGRVGKVCEEMEIPGLLFIAAAAENETSKASNYNYMLKAWMSNSFTDAMLGQFDDPSGISIYDFYLHTYARTIGSHVSVFNADNFDNLYESTIDEFLYP